MSDSIAVRGIRAFGRHGANAGERDVPQPFDVDVDLTIDLRRAGAGDALVQTIDYAALHADIVHIVATTSFALLERLGEELVARMLADERVLGTEVRIAKPGLLAGATPSVTLRRVREG
ncbi:MAG: dihydroneopterin aldolase [Candidatus Velthaea sp.]